MVGDMRISACKSCSGALEFGNSWFDLLKFGWFESGLLVQLVEVHLQDIQVLPCLLRNANLVPISIEIDSMSPGNDLVCAIETEHIEQHLSDGLVPPPSRDNAASAEQRSTMLMYSCNKAPYVSPRGPCHLAANSVNFTTF